MLALEKTQEVERLLAHGRLSEREIARRTGVARNTVARIASARPPAEQLPPDAPPERCPACGSIVAMPCLRCRLEATGIRTGPADDGPCEPLGVGLRGKPLARYEALREKIQTGQSGAAEPSTCNVPPDDGVCDLNPDRLLEAFFERDFFEADPLELCPCDLDPFAFEPTDVAEEENDECRYE